MPARGIYCNLSWRLRRLLCVVLKLVEVAQECDETPMTTETDEVDEEELSWVFE